MRATRFNDKNKYTLGSEPEVHSRDCNCGECVTYVEFMQKRLYGKSMTTRGLVHGPEVPIYTRDKR
jgi:hypothetical protein